MNVSATDATPTDGITAVTVNGTTVNGVDFGINPAPTAITTTQPIQSNPGGTVNVTVPADAFGGADGNGGIITAIKIPSFPQNATSITVNGVNYTNTGFPVNGITVPAGSNGQPTQTITVDPIDGAVTVSINYNTVDNAGLSSSAPGTANVPLKDVPDLTPFLTIDPNVIHGNQQFDMRIRAYNTRPVATSGKITLFIPKSNKWTFTWNPNGETYAALPVSNASWTYTSNAVYHIWTTNAVIGPNGSLSFGYTASFIPGATQGKFPVTVQILYPSGGEIYNGNNTDDESITFFEQ